MKMLTAKPTRQLSDLAGVGPAILSDLHQLGITTVAQLKSCEPEELYRSLCELRGEIIDICCQDVFTAAIAHARNPELEPAKQRWWYWSRERKKSAVKTKRRASY